MRRRLRQRPVPGSVCGDVLVGVVAGADERAGGDVLEPQRVGGLLEQL